MLSPSVMAPMPASGLLRMASAPSTMPAMASMLACFWFFSMRAMWCWVTCPISCPSTLASSESLPATASRPVCTPMKPPGRAKALMLSSRTTKNRNGWPRAGSVPVSRLPKRLMKSFISASS